MLATETGTLAHGPTGPAGCGSVSFFRLQSYE